MDRWFTCSWYEVTAVVVVFTLQSLVVKNTYKETYVIFLMYEHIFSMLYEDGSSIDTRHRLLRKLATPPVCHTPFTINRESADH